MAVISFRTPQDSLEQFHTAIELLREIVSDPAKVKATLEDISQKVAALQELSDSKKQALHDAEEILAQSQEFLDEFAATKAKFAQERKESQTALDLASQQLMNDTNALLAERAQIQASALKAQQDADDKLTEATRLCTIAQGIQLANQQSLTAIAQKQSALEEAAAAFEKLQQQTSDELNAKLVQYEADVAQLEKDRVAFDARQQRIEEALKA